MIDLIDATATFFVEKLDDFVLWALLIPIRL